MVKEDEYEVGVPEKKKKKEKTRGTWTLFTQEETLEPEGKGRTRRVPTEISKVGIKFTIEESLRKGLVA